MFNKSGKLKTLDPMKLAAEARGKDLSMLITEIEQLCVKRGVEVGEWQLISQAIDNRQNKILIKNKIQVYVQPNEGGDLKGAEKQQNNQVPKA